MNLVGVISDHIGGAIEVLIGSALVNSLIFSFVGGRIGANFGKSVEATDENIRRGKKIGVVVANTLALVLAAIYFIRGRV